MASVALAGTAADDCDGAFRCRKKRFGLLPQMISQRRRVWISGAAAFFLPSSGVEGKETRRGFEAENGMETTEGCIIILSGGEGRDLAPFFAGSLTIPFRLVICTVACKSHREWATCKSGLLSRGPSVSMCLPLAFHDCLGSGRAC